MAKEKQTLERCWQECTPRERAFVGSLVIHWNQRKAALDAGYAVKTASLSAVKILKRPHVQRLIEHFQLKAQKQAELTKQMVLEKLATSLSRDLSVFEPTPGGFFVSSLRELPREVDCFIDGFEVKEKVLRRVDEDLELVERTIKVKLTPNAAVQDMVMRHLGLYNADKSGGNTVVQVNLEQLATPTGPNPIEQQILDVENGNG
jgi:hypothetical protein